MTKPNPIVSFTSSPEIDADYLNSVVPEDLQDKCWLWAGLTNRAGYGIISYRYKNKQCHEPAHRATYRAFVGEIPEGYHVHHMCTIRRCINPEHLAAITPTLNTQLIWGINKCKNGHELTEDNVYIDPRIRKRTGKYARQCRQCQRDRTFKNKQIRRKKDPAKYIQYYKQYYQRNKERVAAEYKLKKEAERGNQTT